MVVDLQEKDVYDKIIKHIIDMILDEIEISNQLLAMEMY